MRYLMKGASADNTVLAMLGGGPASPPEASRIQMVAADTQKIKAARLRRV
jgi:hypothetical protein